MKIRYFAGIAAMAFGMVFTATSAFPQTQTLPTSGPAENGSPAWFLRGSAPDLSGRAIVAPNGDVTVPPASAGNGGPPRVSGLAPAACSDDIAKYCSDRPGTYATDCLWQNNDNLSSAECRSQVAEIVAVGANVPGCKGETVCENRLTNGLGPRSRDDLHRVEWKPNMGYTIAYPDPLPQALGGVPAVGLDSKGNLWVRKRSPRGTPQLYEFGPDHQLIRTIGQDVLGYAPKAHGMAIDANDNAWICEAALAIVQEISPQGKLLKTIGVKGHRGDWIESKGQRLLWQPVMIAFAPNGDIYIGEGHGNESPNDVASPDPTNVSGAARIIHLDKDGNYINQWYGNNIGLGKFSQSHGLAIDPRNGDVWIGDREQYTIAVYTANGQFIKELPQRNLVCAIHFDPQGNPWIATGQDGQVLKLDVNGKVVGAIGGGMGSGTGQFVEASYFVFDKQGDIYVADTGIGRVTEFIPPRK